MDIRLTVITSNLLHPRIIFLLRQEKVVVFGVMGMNPSEPFLEMVCPDGLDAVVNPEGDTDPDDEEEGEEDEAEFGGGGATRWT